MISVRPNKSLLAKIKAEAAKEQRKLGPMVCIILERYFNPGHNLPPRDPMKLPRGL